jgi:DNA repair exonuclease SbcCD nuclease subunit
MHFNHTSDAMVEHDGEMIKVDKTLFRRYKNVFLGHFHAAQIIENVEYIGSPLQLSFGEMDQEKHLIIFDGDTSKKEYIINDFSPQHKEVYYTNEESVKDLGNCFAKIYIEDISKIDILNIKQNLPAEILDFKLSHIPKKTVEEVNLVKEAKTVIKNKENMLEKYIAENNAENLETNLLMEMGNKICSMQQA